jgi:UDP-glucose 4-epimerase
VTKILITGGAGFIGSSLAKRLLSKGNEIVIYDNLATGRKENLDFVKGAENFTFLNKDMLDIKSLEEAISNSNKVYHLSANAFVNLGFHNTKIDFDQTVLSTYNLLECMRKSKNCKSLYFTSTSAVYGEHDINVKATENSAPRPVSLYGSSKLAAEALISGYCHTFDIQSIIFRLANIIGPANTHGVIYDFLKKLQVTSKTLEILGSGKQKKPYVHVDECVNALTLFENPTKPLDIFNITADDRTTVDEIAAIILKELGLENTEIKYNREFGDKGWKGDVLEYMLDSTKLKNAGWKLDYNSGEAVTKTVQEYLSGSFNDIIKA